MTLDPKMLPSRRESTLNNRRESTAVNPSSRLSGNSGPRLSLHPHAVMTPIFTSF